LHSRAPLTLPLLVPHLLLLLLPLLLLVCGGGLPHLCVRLVWRRCSHLFPWLPLAALLLPFV
jgi:hypothetical protein